MTRPASARRTGCPAMLAACGAQLVDRARCMVVRAGAVAGESALVPAQALVPLLAVMLARMREGASIEDAFRQALQFTGRVVMLTGLTLALAVGTWVFSPIKFQADMGLLLAFMFVWNMIGALVLLPALARFLLRPTAPAAADRPVDEAGRDGTRGARPPDLRRTAVPPAQVLE